MVAAEPAQDQPVWQIVLQTGRWQPELIGQTVSRHAAGVLAGREQVAAGSSRVGDRRLLQVVSSSMHAVARRRQCAWLLWLLLATPWAPFGLARPLPATPSNSSSSRSRRLLQSAGQTRLMRALLDPGTTTTTIQGMVYFHLSNRHYNCKAFNYWSHAAPLQVSA